jgi:hypothetical protein
LTVDRSMDGISKRALDLRRPESSDWARNRSDIQGSRLERLRLYVIGKSLAGERKRGRSIRLRVGRLQHRFQFGYQVIAS